MAVTEAQLKKLLAKYKYRDLSVREILNVISLYRDLKPIMDSYVFNDGSTRELLNLSGTIPVPYKGNTYNIPICLWLLDTYPFNPPICFVKPTSTMTIKTGKHVDANGKIYLPYLHEWKHPPSDLLGLIQILIVVFGEEPPVFSRSAAPAPYPMYPAQGPPNRTTRTSPSDNIDIYSASPELPSFLAQLVASGPLGCFPEEDLEEIKAELTATQPLENVPASPQSFSPPQAHSFTEESQAQEPPKESCESILSRLNTISNLRRHEYRSLKLSIDALAQEQRRQHEETMDLIRLSVSNLGDVIREGFQQLQETYSTAANLQRNKSTGQDLQTPDKSAEQPPLVKASAPVSNDISGFGG
ncbi:tumor susceptibility gene 101 protein isoform 2-T2 [Discoglossus pictus]